jgi:hypothetical protein
MDDERRSSPVTNYVLQLLGIGLVVIFGVYQALSYVVAKESIQQAQIANQLTLLSFCTSGTTVSFTLLAL